ncbi:MAG TPA: DUF4349 domain-containing protein [Holophagaceae bacterium]|nr:DUF4349 domain-containing protein [Holophagaceae bacterium]
MDLRPWMKKIAVGLSAVVGVPLLLRAVEEVEGGAGPQGLRALKTVALCMAPPPPPPPPPPPGVPGGIPGGVIGGVVGGTAENSEEGASFSAHEQVQSLQASEAKLIRKGDLQLEVKDVPQAREAILQRTKALGGWIADQGEQRDEDGHLTANLTLRLPADRFEAGQQSLRELGTVRRIHLEVEDVSREWVDREARLQVKRTAAGRLRQILAQKSASLKDVLAAEQALIRLTEEIESLESIHRFQSRQVAYATLEIQLLGPQAAVTRAATSPLSRFGDQILTRLSASLAVLGLLIAALLPWALLGLGIRTVLRRRRTQAPTLEADHG